MNWLKQLLSRRRLYSEVSEEIQAHLDEKIEELVAGGMSREAAGYAARREFGNVGLTEENGREAWRWPSIDNRPTERRAGPLARHLPLATHRRPAREPDPATRRTPDQSDPSRNRTARFILGRLDLS